MGGEPFREPNADSLQSESAILAELNEGIGTDEPTPDLFLTNLERMLVVPHHTPADLHSLLADFSGRIEERYHGVESHRAKDMVMLAGQLSRLGKLATKEEILLGLFKIHAAYNQALVKRGGAFKRKN